MIDRARIRELLTTRWLGRELEVHERLSSTNDRALAVGGPRGLVVVADVQDRGRGREGRRWQAPVGSSLLMSLVAVSDRRAAEVARLTFAVGVGVARAVRGAGFAEAAIKWPNDVLIGRDKIAGVLCESRIIGARTGVVVVGIGLNVNTPRTELPAGATSLYALDGSRYERERLLVDLLASLEPELDALEAGDWVGVRQRWEALSALHCGAPVRLEAGDEGVTDGIDDDGALRVRTPTGVVRCSSGGVRFVELNGPGASIGGG